ncbi:hypothetical protein P8822_00130 [Bacillus sonorensis]|uniref:hypothetical protein n=1 Tax=Bacillus sonorensis TaxID=119858 RepID=UPI002DBB477C|nr:hypothetical protein [Bacillus sonorensis]MEC0526221.1 hypothetical protein [Bacillus sonorensis]
MKKKSYKSIYINIFLVILCAVLALTIVHLKSQSDDHLKRYTTVNEKLKRTQNDYKELSSEYKELSRINGLSTNELTAKQTITNLFNTLFNYDNNNYASRFDKAEKYMNSNVIEKLKGAGGDIQAPKAKIEKQIKKIEIFRQIEKSENITALVQIKSTYSVDGEDNPEVNELYKVRVNLKTNKIEFFQLLGALNVVDES